MFHSGGGFWMGEAMHVVGQGGKSLYLLLCIAVNWKVLQNVKSVILILKKKCSYLLCVKNRDLLIIFLLLLLLHYFCQYCFKFLFYVIYEKNKSGKKTPEAEIFHWIATSNFKMLIIKENLYSLFFVQHFNCTFSITIYSLYTPIPSAITTLLSMSMSPFPFLLSTSTP